MSNDNLDARNRPGALSDLANELGAITSGEEALCPNAPTYIQERSQRFATGLLRLIREEIAAAGAVPHNPPMDAVGVVDVPKAAEPVPRATYWICAGADGCPGSGVIGGPRPCPNCRKPCVECYGNGQPVEPEEPAQVKAGDTFLRMRGAVTGGNEGRVFTVCDVDGERVNSKSPELPGDTVRPWCVGDAAFFLDPTEFQRVPAGYVLPTAIEWHAKIRVLVAARDRMRADPETGTKGVDDCITQMAAMAGMEVPA